MTGARTNSTETTALVAAPTGWTGAELAADPTSWTHHLSDDEVAELDALAAGAEVQTPALTAAAKGWIDDVRHGRGFVTIRGVPVDRWTVDEARAAFVALGRLVGSPMTQNAAGDLVADVRAERDVADPSARRYETAEDTPFHTDGSDMIALLCLQQGRSGGQSSISSSVNVVNVVAAERPDLVPLLLEPWPFAMTRDAVDHFEVPLVASLEPFSFFYIRWYVEQSQRVAGAPRLTADHVALLDLIDDAAEAGRLDIDFAPGDIQLLSNRTVMHSRTPFVDWDEPRRRRHLLRLWLEHHEEM